MKTAFLYSVQQRAQEIMILGLKVDGGRLTSSRLADFYENRTKLYSERMRYRRRMGRLRDPLLGGRALELAPSEEANHRGTGPRFSSSLSGPRAGRGSRLEG